MDSLGNNATVCEVTACFSEGSVELLKTLSGRKYRLCPSCSRAFDMGRRDALDSTTLRLGNQIKIGQQNAVAGGKILGRPRSLTPGEEATVIRQYKTGAYTQANLGDKHGTSSYTIGRIIRDARNGTMLRIVSLN